MRRGSSRRAACGRSSVGRASASQAECREFESLRPLHFGRGLGRSVIRVSRALCHSGASNWKNAPRGSPGRRWPRRTFPSLARTPGGCSRCSAGLPAAPAPPELRATSATPPPRGCGPSRSCNGTAPATAPRLQARGTACLTTRSRWGAGHSRRLVGRKVVGCVSGLDSRLRTRRARRGCASIYGLVARQHDVQIKRTTCPIRSTAVPTMNDDRARARPGMQTPPVRLASSRSLTSHAIS